MTMTTVAQVQRSISNALGDLYRIERHSVQMTPAQKRAVQDTIRALEDEYIALRGSPEIQSYAAITQRINTARTDLIRIKDERKQLENLFASAAKILGSTTRLLALLP
ncbi:hypothetical protein [Jannaschia sp. CCS1]|uniref:hypothetical protein n=1 Tax=Jannaschia sp. (strain CCS1) TaxID=290400 RepID=UPI000053C896|nr:hypothetical protein [Jannaschia sp. CCS1]ABD56449.1 hypothetical protein Jann_3532 [Jannaschia sp. CCS1]